jgi:hypothetical protein
MKKIILVTLCGLVITQGYSQNAGQPGNSKVMSVEEANRLNGVGHPTINGKPYSQYKAEQDALKQQQAAKTVQPTNTPIPQGLTLKVSNDTNDPALARMNEPVLKGGPDPDKAPNSNIAQTKEPVKEEVTGVVGTPLMKPVMTGGIQQGTATKIVNSQKEENKSRENLNKTQEVEPKQQTTVPAPAELKVASGQKKE